MRWILLIVIITGCGDTFESELFLEGQNDADINHDTGTIGQDTGVAGIPGWVDSGESGQSNDSSNEAQDSTDGSRGDTSPDTTGDAGNDASPEAETGVTCDPYQCQVTCASQGKACSECECV